MDDKMDSEQLTKEKLIEKLSRKATEDSINVNKKSWLVGAFTHPSFKVTQICHSILKELTFPATTTLVFEIYLASMTELFKNPKFNSEFFFKGFKDFLQTSFKAPSTTPNKSAIILPEPSPSKPLQRITNSLFALIEKQLEKLNTTYSSHLNETSSLLIMSMTSGHEIYELLDSLNALFKNNQPLLTSLKSSPDALQFLLRALLLTRKFSPIQNHFLADSQNILSQLFTSLQPDTPASKMSFLSQSLSTLLHIPDPLS